VRSARDASEREADHNVTLRKQKLRGAAAAKAKRKRVGRKGGEVPAFERWSERYSKAQTGTGCASKIIGDDRGEQARGRSRAADLDKESKIVISKGEGGGGVGCHLYSGGELLLWKTASL